MNVVQGLLILEVFLYMQDKSRIYGYSLWELLPSQLVGVFLGMCSSFLGIGGGPINVALIILLLSYPAKTVTVRSLVTGFAGRFICAGLNKSFSENLQL